MSWENSFTKWNVLQAATPSFRMGISEESRSQIHQRELFRVEMLVLRDYRAAV
jgi:hypothetical protein